MTLGNEICTSIPIRHIAYTSDGSEIYQQTCWGWYFVPLFAGFYTCQVVSYPDAYLWFSMNLLLWISPLHLSSPKSWLDPKETPHQFIPHYGSMGRTIYFPTFTIKINHSCRYIYHTWILWVLHQTSQVSFLQINVFTCFPHWKRGWSYDSCRKKGDPNDAQKQGRRKKTPNFIREITNVPQSSLGILRVPQLPPPLEHPGTLKIPTNWGMDNPPAPSLLEWVWPSTREKFHADISRGAPWIGFQNKKCLETRNELIWVVVSNIFYVQPYLGKIPILTNMFQMGWNHHLVMFFFFGGLWLVESLTG